jgi:hypothetical protein
MVNHHQKVCNVFLTINLNNLQAFSFSVGLGHSQQTYIFMRRPIH